MKNMMRFLAAAKVAVLFFALTPLALAQEIQSTTEKLSECVAVFTQGGPMEWILGGVFLIATVLGMFFRHSVVSLLKDIAGKLLDGKKR